MDTIESLLLLNHARGWRMGLANMLAKELAAWWRTRRWWVQCLVALLLLNGMLALNLGNDQRPANAGASFLLIAALAAPIAAISLAQDSILGERHSGTAAWVLSKPMRRPAFLLSKLAAHGLGLLVAWIVLPGALAYVQLRPAIGHELSGIGFVGAMGLDTLNLLFYLTLSLMLATLFNGRGAVLGIAILVDFTGLMQFITLPVQKYAPWLGSIMPWRLVNSRVILVHACSPKVGQPCAPKLGQSCSPILVHLCAPKLVQSCSPELVHDGSGGTPRPGAYCPLHNERAGEGRCPERGRRPWTYGRF